MYGFHFHSKMKYHIHNINLFHLQFTLIQSHDLDTDVTKEKVLAVDDKNVMISFFVGKERKIGARRDTNSIR